MRRKLLDDVTIQEMLTMRESGMTNDDIANALGVSYPTVYRAIGKQPSRGGWVARSIHVKTQRVEAQTEEHDAVLPVVNRVTSLAGKWATYSVDAGEKTVKIECGDWQIGIPFGEWQTFCAEVEAIGRNLGRQIVGAEMW